MKGPTVYFGANREGDPATAGWEIVCAQIAEAILECLLRRAAAYPALRGVKWQPIYRLQFGWYHGILRPMYGMEDFYVALKGDKWL